MIAMRPNFLVFRARSDMSSPFAGGAAAAEMERDDPSGPNCRRFPKKRQTTTLLNEHAERHKQLYGFETGLVGQLQTSLSQAGQRSRTEGPNLDSQVTATGWEASEYFQQMSPPQSDNKDTTSSNSPKSSSSNDDVADLQVAAPKAAHRDSLRKRRAANNRPMSSHHGEYHTGDMRMESESSTNSDEEQGKLAQSMDQLDFDGANERMDVSPGGNVLEARTLVPGPATLLLQHHVHRRSTQEDPRSWDMDNVQKWLKHEGRKHSVAVDLERFHMNGKGLVLIGLQGFQRRVPHSGHLLHRDLRRILRAQQIVQRR